MRIAIYGTGGAGGYFGAQLARTGEDITFIARCQHLKAIQAHVSGVKRTSAGHFEMSAFDPKRTYRHAKPMSAFGGKANISSTSLDVRS